MVGGCRLPLLLPIIVDTVGSELVQNHNIRDRITGSTTKDLRKIKTKKKKLTMASCTGAH